MCILATPGNANGLCGSSDPAMFVCSGVWGLLSFVGLIIWLRWKGVYPSEGDEPIAKLPELLRKS
jgi:hypothetical protein